MKPFFQPDSVAIVGASPEPTKVGGVVLQNFLTNVEKGIFKGVVYPVNPKYSEIFGRRCYASLADIDRSVETIVVAVPAAVVPQVLREAGRRGVKAAIIISSGFSEIGNRGLEQEVAGLAREFGIRVIGPNCLGVYDPFSGVDTLFLPTFKMLSTGREVLATPRPRPGSIVVISQSGAFGVAALDYFAGRGMGVRSFVSLGNRLDVAEHELLRYFGEDEQTKVIFLYIEGLREGRKFYEAAKKVTKKKPVVAYKAGKTAAGTRAAASHTASLSGMDRVYDAAFRQSGVIRAKGLEDLFDIARALSLQPPAPTEAVAILTNAGGPAIVAIDALADAGVKVDRFSRRTTAKLEKLRASGELLPVATFVNPADLSGLATSEMFAKALRTLLEDRGIGGVVVMPLHHTPTIVDDVVQVIAQVSKPYGKPVIACEIGETEMAEVMRAEFEKHGIPAYPMPERAARAMCSLIEYGRYLKKASA